MDCAFCPTGDIIAELEARVKQLEEWKAKAREVLLKCYSVGIDIERLISIKDTSH